MAIFKRRLNDISPNDNPQDEPPPKTAKTTHTRNHRIQECTICASDLPLKSFPSKLGHRAPNTRHSTCSACWQQHLATQLTADKPTSQITCPQCPYVLREVDIKALGSAETYAAFLDKMFQEAMQADPNWRTCPEATCSFGYLLTQEDEQSDSIFNCRVCQAQYCVRCEVPMHRGQTCEAYQAENNGRNVNEDEEASRVFLEEYAKVCPKCGVRIRKNGGCDHMTCRKCKHEFCWLCFAAYRGPQGIHTVGNGAHEGTCRYHPDVLHRTAMSPSPIRRTFPQPNRPTPAAPTQANRPRRRGRGRPIQTSGGRLQAQREQQRVRDERQAVVGEEVILETVPNVSHAAALLAARRARQNQPPVQNNRPARMRLDDDSRDELRAARRSLEGPQPAQNNRPTRLFAAHDSGDETDWGALARAISPAPQHAEPPEAAQGLGITGLDGDDYDGEDIIVRATRTSPTPELHARFTQAASPAVSDFSADYDPTPPTIRASMSPEPQAQTPRDASPASVASTDSSVIEVAPPPRAPSVASISSNDALAFQAFFNPSPEPQQPRPSSLSPMLSTPELSPLGRPPPRHRAASPQPQTPPGRRNAVAPQSNPLFSRETSPQPRTDTRSPPLSPDFVTYLPPPPRRRRTSSTRAVVNTLHGASLLVAERNLSSRFRDEQPVMERNLSTRFRDVPEVIDEERVVYEFDEEGFAIEDVGGEYHDGGEEVVLDG
ncbi:hypothetical protein PRZ48_014505 [Zasmidium cellare]|uniref:RBR-type E3 ubiquitin transferase n=1 Tax=Zasmidium cellare TaxID=395010 RepID=A0ABR0DYI7_ZASCE|nr:hypothetical protein PRZ48_014505 [Zasmidium cellare]